MKPRSNIPAILIAGLLAIITQQVVYVASVNALANPITGGKSHRMTVLKTPTRIPATGQKCNVVVSNVDVNTAKFPVYACYLQFDGGPCMATIGQPICNNSVTTFTGCISNWFSFDAVPDSIYLVADIIPDGGIPVRVLNGTGCTAP